jgi:mannose-6-phosphate isomerase-like protein (cupin superfamily)
MRCAQKLCLGLVLTLASGASHTLAQTAQVPPPAKPTQSPPPPAAKPRQSAPPAGRLTLTIMVTALDGKTLPGTTVTATGPVDRESQSDPSGLVTFPNLSPGTYRLRFEHEQFVTLEKEVSLAAGKPLRVSVSLTAAPPPPLPPKPEPAPLPPPPAPDGSYSASATSIPDFIEKNYVGNASVKRSPLGCGGSSTSTLIQTKDPIAEHTHDADEIIYVVAGEGTHKVDGREAPLLAGSFAFVPKGIPHSLNRRGSRPLIFLSTLAGPACPPTAK